MELNWSNRYLEIEKIQEAKNSGVISYLPWTDMPKLSNLYPGVIPATYTIISADSGAGKSKTWRALFVNHVLDFLERNPTVKYTILANCLEESEDDIKDAFLISSLARKGIFITPFELNGYSENSLSPEKMAAIAAESEYLNGVLSNVLVYLDEGNPFGFYKKVRAFAAENGKFIKGDAEVDIHSSKEIPWDRYVKNDPNHIVVALIDHITLFSAEAGKSKYQSLEYLSQEYLRRKISKSFGFHVVVVQQQVKRQKDFDRKGNLIIPKLYPSGEDLSEIKITYNDCLTFFGLFSPYYYDIEEIQIEGRKQPLSMADFNGNFRLLCLKKNRKGAAYRTIPVVLNPILEQFVEIDINNLGPAIEFSKLGL